MGQIKISDLTPKGAPLATTDLFVIAQATSDDYESKSITGAEIIESAQEGLQPTLVSGTNIKTVNGNSLLGSGDLVIGGGGLTIGTTAITSGTIGRILFEGTGNVLQESANFFWDNTNSRLGINTASPNMALDIRTGNVGIGVTSNAGYKLDVNGTARVQGNLDVTGANILTTRYLNINSVGQGARIEYTYSGGTLVQLGRMQGTTGTNRQFDIISKTPDYGVTSQQILTLFPSASIKYSNAAAVSTTVATETASACFEVESTTKGFLPPRMTTTQRNAIASPASGLIVYDTTLNKLCVRTASTWETITSV